MHEFASRCRYPSWAEAQAAVAAVRAAGANVLVGCLCQSAGEAVVAAMQCVPASPSCEPFSPLALVLTSAFIRGWEGEYVLSPSPWHPSVDWPRGEYSNWTSARFARGYEELGAAPPEYRGASMFAALCALCAAIEAAGTTQPEAVAAALRATDLSEFYGRVAFDGERMNSAHGLLVLQHMPNTDARAIVAPAHEVVDAAVTLLFPMPSWEERWCRHIGAGLTRRDDTGSTLPVECSGHGTCDTSGACVCDADHVGATCDQLATGCARDLSLGVLCIDNWGVAVLIVGVGSVLVAALAVYLCIRCIA